YGLHPAPSDRVRSLNRPNPVKAQGKAAGCRRVVSPLPNSGSGESWFEPRRGNCNARPYFGRPGVITLGPIATETRRRAFPMNNPPHLSFVHAKGMAHWF